MLIHQDSCLPLRTCRTNPVRVPGVIVRLCPLAWSTGLQGQVNPLASVETTVLKTRFGPGDAGDPLSRSIAIDRTSTERSCHLGKGGLAAEDNANAIKIAKEFKSKGNWTGVHWQIASPNSTFQLVPFRENPFSRIFLSRSIPHEGRGENERNRRRVMF